MKPFNVQKECKADILNACTIVQSCIEGCMSVVLPRWMVIDTVWWSRDAKKFQAVVEGLWSVYRVKTVGKRERKRERENRKKETRRKTRKGKGRCWYQRRNELDTSVYGRLRGRYYDVQARARCSFLQPHPHTNFFLFFLFSFFSFPLFSFFFSTSTSSSFNSVHRLSHGRSILPVTWTLCGAASIKPHFYSGALYSLRSARLPPTFHGSLLHKRARVSRFFSAQPLEKYSNTHSRTPMV